MIKGLEYLSHEESLQELRPFSLKQRRLGDFINMYKHLVGENED